MTVLAKTISILHRETDNQVQVHLVAIDGS
jgi:hypothetical protein